MKIVVLGSSGFIGRNLITELKRSTNFNIYGFNRSEGLDLLDYSALSEKIKELKPDVIYNVAYLSLIQCMFKYFVYNIYII